MTRSRSVLLITTVALAIVATVLAVSGGFRTTVGGFRLSARSPVAATIAALIAAGAWAALARRAGAMAADLEAAWQDLERHAARIIGGIAMTAAVVAAVFATRSAAGADASGYLSEADLFAGRAYRYFEPLAINLANFDGWITTPLGWRPSLPALQSPTYPPGLPMLMAVPHALGGIAAANAMVIAAAAIAVWATGMIARGRAGILAAVLIAFTPVFLYQSFQPMSDVPVTAAWMLCFLLVTDDRRSLWAGAACAVAVLIRPNLAPAAIVPFLLAANRVAFATPVVLAAAFLGLMQWLWYGSPWRSGYGSASELFSPANAGPNAARYLDWLIATAPVLLLAPLGLRRIGANRHARALAVFALLVIAAYLIYGVFDQWSYLRFLLPALAVFALLAAIELTAWIERSPMAWRLPLLLLAALAVTAQGLAAARSRDAFRLADQLRRVEQIAAFIDRETPPHAVVIAGEQSGSMRYYTGRSIVRWDAAAPDTLQAAIDVLERSERPLYVVLDAWEEEPFRRKFQDVPAVALGWPPAADAGTSHRTRAWRLADRDRFLAGGTITTVRLP